MSSQESVPHHYTKEAAPYKLVTELPFVGYCPLYWFPTMVSDYTGPNGLSQSFHLGFSEKPPAELSDKRFKFLSEHDGMPTESDRSKWSANELRAHEYLESLRPDLQLHKLQPDIWRLVDSARLSQYRPPSPEPDFDIDPVTGGFRV